MTNTLKSYVSPAGRVYGKAAQTFISHMAKGGDQNTAVKLAGWNPKNLSVYASSCRLKYRAAIDRAVMDRMMDDQPVAYDVIVRLAGDPDTPAAVRLQAAKYIIDNGHTVRSGQATEIKKEQSTAELIKSFCDSVGAPATILALNKIGIPVPEYITAQAAGQFIPGAPGTVQALPAPYPDPATNEE